MILSFLFLAAAARVSAPGIDMYIGTYTAGQASKGIYRVRLDAETGQLSEPVLAGEAVNPSYLAMDSKQHSLYAVNESHGGEVVAFAIQTGGNLRRLNAQQSHGADPCHLSVSPGDRSVLVANYSSGNVACFPILADGSIGASDGGFQNTGKGPNPDRQEGPHMHMVSIDPRQRFACACDLGTDEVLTFHFSRQGGEPALALPKRIKTPPGSGPRHAVFDHAGTHLYVDNELASTVSVFSVEDRSGPVREIQNITTLLPNTNRQNHPAEIVMHPSGRWLYVSNRGHDSIACYDVGQGGRLKLQDVIRLPVHEPRGFAVDPSGRWLVVGGQHSNNLAAMEIDQTNGLLKPERSIVRIGSPVCVLFVKP